MADQALDSIQLQIEHLHEQDRRLRSDMHTGFEAITTQISALSDDLKKNSATNWPVLIAIMGFLLSVVTIIGAMALGPIKADISQLYAHSEKDGHPETVIAALNGLQMRVAGNKDSMRRELDMRFSAIEKRLDRIDYEGSKVWKFLDSERNPQE